MKFSQIFTGNSVDFSQLRCLPAVLQVGSESSAIWCGDLNLDHGSLGNAGLLYGGNKLWEFRVTPCKSVPQVLKFK